MKFMTRLLDKLLESLNELRQWYQENAASIASIRAWLRTVIARIKERKSSKS